MNGALDYKNLAAYVLGELNAVHGAMLSKALLRPISIDDIEDAVIAAMNDLTEMRSL